MLKCLTFLSDIYFFIMAVRLISWNVNGIRSIIKKGFLDSVKALDPDVLCLQETKAQNEETRNVLELLSGYTLHVNSAKNRKGYSGTAVLSKPDILNVTYDLGIEEHDQEGRVITAEYPEFFLVNVYVPNSGRGLVRLDYRQTWDQDFLQYLKKLEETKPVVVMGDLNVAHQEIDIARPKANYNKSAGYTQAEIDGFSHLLDNGFVDTFRRLNPGQVAYTYWNYMFNARERDVGWRIDYVLVSELLMRNVKDTFIFNEHMGSDHCPVGIELSF